MRRILIAAAVALSALSGRADRYTDYIELYHHLAEAEMEEFGIPASITLAQGLLESAAGRSTLASEGNNHFGIKCHRDWDGETMLRSDDAPDECFRVYDSPADSFRDHSLFLTKKRYAPLFQLAPNDYAGWAKGLKKCGYATDPHYADRLIAIVERYSLYEYDMPERERPEEIAEFIRTELGNTHRIFKYRGLHYIVANPGDTYESLAKEFSADPGKLALYNDSKSTRKEIRPWEEVYLQAKHEDGPEDLESIVIGEDEDMRSISQRLGMSLKSLKTMNKKVKDKPGSRLRLR